MKVTGAWIAVAIAVVAAMIAGHIDISAARFFRSDVVVRDAFPGVTEPPYYDPAPYSLWLPSDWFVWDSIRSGHLPLWDRLQGGGYSPVLTVQNGVFHPLRWAVALAPREMAPSILIVLALFLCASGIWTLLRESRRSATAAALGAVIFTLSSPVLGNIHFSGDLLPLAHTPWIAFFARRTGRNPSLGNLAGLISGIALLLLAGHPLFVVTVALVVIGFSTAEAFDLRSIRPLVTLAVAAATAIALDAFAFVPPIVSLPDLWFYKTETHQGSVYALFDPFERWLRAILSMFVDLRSPSSSTFDEPAFWLYIGIPVALLAAIGVIDALQRTRDRAIAGVLLVLSMLSVPGPWMVDLASTKPLTFMNRSYFAGGMTFTLAILAAGGFDFLWHTGRRGRVVALICAVATSVVYVMRADEVLQPHRWSEIVRGETISFLRRDRSHRIIGTLGQTHLPNSSRITGIEDVRESTPVWTLRKHRWWEAVDPHIRRYAFPTFRMTEELGSALIGDFNVRWIVRSRLAASAFHNAGGPERRPAVEVELWRPGIVRPRVHFAERVLVVRTMDEAARLLRDDRSLAATTAVIEAAIPPLSQARGEVTLRYPSESTVAIDVSSPSGGLVVLHDAYDRGWRARLDDRPLEILPVNLISRGFVVKPGHHHVEMAYEPPGFRLGVGISAVTALSLAMAAAVALRGGRRSPQVAAE
ncbi:MAG: YfhO family protein [Thermoanaerobaculia bacterium]